MMVTFFLSSYPMQVTVLSALHLLSHLNLTTTLRNKYFLKPHFAKKEIELPKLKR